LCKALGREDLANNPRFRTNPDKVASRVVLVRMLQEIFATNSREYWLKLLKESIIRKSKDIASNLGIRWFRGIDHSME
jgi:crotonobetainyl-CoA:carnitine CoA-transferase CaiB-like acyl-CoA transferase